MSPVLPLKLISGLNLTDEVVADELIEAEDMSYDKDGILSTRRGTATFGEPIPDTVVAINLCDATTNFAVADDATTLALETSLNRRNTGAVKFNIDVSNSASNFATLSNAVLGSVDITLTKGYFGFWFFMPTGGDTNLTSVRIRLGTDASNYYEWTIVAADLTANKYQFLANEFADASITGTIDDTDINFFQLEVIYTAAYLDVLLWQVDDLQAYSATATAPPTSYFRYERDDVVTAINLVKQLALVVAGTNMFQLDDSTKFWTVIDTGLTEFETEVGRTTERTRWTFTVYRNEIGMCNGIDNYRKFDGVLITEFGAQPKVRHLLYMADSVLGIGEDLNPITLYYSNPAAANLNAIDTNALVVGGDEGAGRGNGLLKMTVQNSVLALIITNNQIFLVNIASGAESSDPINTQNGGFSDRVLIEVGNAIMVLTDNGLDTLKIKRAGQNAEAVESLPITNNIQDFLREIEPKQLNANCALYAKPLKNFYFSFDSDGNNRPDKTLVLTTLIRGDIWTKHNLPSAYDYGEYVESDGTTRYLLASADGGQMFEIETGFDDSGVEILFRLSTSDFDPINPKDRNRTQFKTFDWVNFVGDMNEAGIIHTEIYIGEDLQRAEDITDANLDTSASSATPIGVKPTGTGGIGGGGSDDDIDIFPFAKRVPLWGEMGATIRIVAFGDPKTLHARFRQITISADGQTFDLIPNSMTA